MLHWRSTELKTDIENNLSSWSSKCVLGTVCHKNKAVFYAHINCITTSYRSTEERKFTIHEMNSHINVLKTM